jgi:hypothetical protein
MCSVSALIGGGGAGSILEAVRDRPRPAPMEMAEWLADRVRCPGIRTPLATLFGRAMSSTTDRMGFGALWSETPIQPLGTWPGTTWQEVARLADLAANRESMARLLGRRSPMSIQAVASMRDLLGATEEEFRERAGWEWVLEAAVRRSREEVEIASTVGALRVAAPADTSIIPLGVSNEWPRPRVTDMPRQRAAGE